MNPKWHFTPLSNDQKARLSILAKEAWIIAQRRGAVDDGVTFDVWRYAQQKEACGVESLKEANQSHFLAVRGKWFTIIGNLEQAFYDFLNAGNELARQLKWRLAGEVARLADGIQAEKARENPPVMIDAAKAAEEAWNYTRGMASLPLFGAKGLKNLNAEDLKRLCDTVFNRASPKLGVGKAENRNKSQRRKALKPSKGAAGEGNFGCSNSA